MKKLLVLLLLFLLSCGPSEEEIQERINQAVEEATSTSTTTTLALITTTSTSTSTTSTSTSTSTTSTSTSTSTTSTSTSTSTTSTTTTTVYVDNEPPTWPDKTINIVNLNPTYFEVLWEPASDNINVAGYKFYLNNVFKGEYIRNNDNNSIFLDGLSAGTSYSLEIIAYDDESNQSIDNPTLEITTTTPTTTTTTVPKVQYTKTERINGFFPSDCEGNGCKLITMCNDSDNHSVISWTWNRILGTNSETNSLLTILSQEGYNNQIHSNSGFGGVISEFQSIPSETVDSYTEAEWGFIDIQFVCEY